MIKRLWFGSLDDERPWRRALAAPSGTAPARVTESSPLPDLGPEPPWALVGTAWFADADHVERCDGWVGGDGITLVADEVVVRGAGWLDRRWAEGGPRLKHLAVARRAPGLSATEFSERWRSHAGTVGSTPIPDIARGQAYVQDHPISGDPPYDAVTEVWFDDLGALRARVAWMDEALAVAPPDDLFGDRHLFAVREELLLPPTGLPGTPRTSP